MNKKRKRTFGVIAGLTVLVLVSAALVVYSFPRPITPTQGSPIPPPPNIEALMVITSTPGSIPSYNLAVGELKQYLTSKGYDKFFLFADCTRPGKIPKYFRKNVKFTDGRFSVTLDLSDVEIGCSYHNKMAVITTDDMTGEGWTKISDVWVSP